MRIIIGRQVYLVYSLAYIQSLPSQPVDIFCFNDNLSVMFATESEKDRKTTTTTTTRLLRENIITYAASSYNNDNNNISPPATDG